MKPSTTIERTANRRDIFSSAFSLSETEETIIKALRGAEDADNGRFRPAADVFDDLRRHFSA